MELTLPQITPEIIHQSVLHMKPLERPNGLSMNDFFAQGFQMMLVLLLAPLLIGVIRKVKAHLLRRRGASVLQPYFDLWKLLRKEPVAAGHASWVYRGAPYLIFLSTWAAASLVPVCSSGMVFHGAADLIVIAGLMALARFALALAGMDIGTSFGGIGSSREMMISTLAEPAMLMVAFIVAMLAHTTQLPGIVSFILHQPVGLRISLGLALITFVIVLLAENARIPVDNPATHLELTMVHEAMVLEYSGRHLALIEAAAALKLLLYMSVFACLFLPFGMADGINKAEPLQYGVITYVLKIIGGGVLLAIGETSVAKMRVFRVAEFIGIGLMFGLLAVLLLFVSRELG
jgi:formate hydrogenlyase subunit 4